MYRYASRLLTTLLMYGTAYHLWQYEEERPSGLSVIVDLKRELHAIDAAHGMVVP